MGSLLAQSGPRHLTHDLLSALETLLAAVGPCEELVHDVLRHLVVNLRLWRAAPAEVQQHLVLILLQLAQVGGGLCNLYLLGEYIGSLKTTKCQ